VLGDLVAPKIYDCISTKPRIHDTEAPGSNNFVLLQKRKKPSS